MTTTARHPVHEAAEIFPMLSEAALTSLATDIQKHGLADPIVIYQGKLLDGRNRLAACEMVDVAPRFVDRTAEIKDPVAYVWSHNAERRHLSESQKAMAGARMRALFEIEARHRNELGGAAARGDAEASATLRKADPLHASVEAAKVVGVSARSVDSAVRVLKFAPPVLVSAVEAGRVPVSTAAAIAEEVDDKEAEELVARGPKEILQRAKEIQRAKRDSNRSKKIEIIEQIARGNGPLLTATKFPIQAWDPSWKYDDGTTDPSRRVDLKYPPMALDEIKALPVGECSTPDALLFLWAVNPMLPEALEVMKAWGFEYRSNWAWDKEIAGGGYWGRGQHELVLIGVRGNFPTPPEATRPPSQMRERRREHSRKPDEFYQRIERMFPTLPKLEGFARDVRPGWTGWGNQATPQLGGAVLGDAASAGGDASITTASPTVTTAPGLEAGEIGQADEERSAALDLHASALLGDFSDALGRKDFAAARETLALLAEFPMDPGTAEDVGEYIDPGDMAGLLVALHDAEEAAAAPTK